MKNLMSVPIAAALLSLSYLAFSADPADRPAGVAAANWVAVSDRLGIVLSDATVPMGPVEQLPEAIGPDGKSMIPLSRGSRFPAPAGQALLLKPPVGGYFMVKGAGGWTRLLVFEPLKGPGDAG